MAINSPKYQTFINFFNNEFVFKLVAKGASIAFILHVIGVVAMYSLNILLARTLGLNGYGTFSYILAWANFLAIPFTVGLPTVVLRYVPIYNGRKEYGKLGGLLVFSWFFILSLNIIMISFISILSLNTKIALGSLPKHILFWGVSLVPLFALLKLQSSIAKAFYKIFLSEFPLMVIYPITIIVLVLVLSFIGISFDTVYILKAIFVVLLFCLIIQLIFLLPELYKKNVPYEYNVITWLKVALPMTLISGFTILLGKTDILMIGALTNTASVGIYNVAAKTSNLLSFFLTAVNTVAAPLFASLWASKRIEELQNLLIKISHIIFWPSILVGVFLFIGADVLLQIFGQEYVQSKYPLYVLILGQLFNAGAGSVGYLLSMTGNQTRALFIYLLGAVLNVFLNYFLIKYFGVIGAAYATCASMIFINVLLNNSVKNNLKVKPSIINALLYLSKVKSL